MITIRMPVIKRCPFKAEYDAGELVITLPGDAPEIHGLDKEIHGELCREPLSHEEFTRAVFDIIGREGLVVTRWHTGTATVEVTEGNADSFRDPEYRAGA